MSKSVEQRVSIDEALEKTQFGSFNYFIIVVSGLIILNVFVECTGLSFVLPVINCDMDLTYREKGFLGAVGFLGIISSSHLWGFLADTTGRRKIIRPTLIAAYLVTVASSFSPDFLTLVVLRFMNGFLLSAGSATIFAYLGEFHCNKIRNRAIMSAGFICAVSSLLYPLVAWAVINQTWSFNVPILGIVYKPWRMYTLVIGLLGLICAASLFYLPESPKYLLSIGREDKVIAVLRKIYSINTGNSMDSYEVNSIMPDAEEEKRFVAKSCEKSSALGALLRSMWNQTAPLFMHEHCRKTVLACVIQFCIFFTAHGLYMWFPYILNKVMQFTSKNLDHELELCEILYLMEDAEYTIVNSTQNECNQFLELSTYQHTLSLEIIFVGVFLGVGYFTGKIGRIPTLFIILIFCGICGILSAIITIPIVAVYFLLALLVCGLGATVLNSITVDMFPTHLRAMAVCISLMVGRIGSVAGTNIIGMLLEHNCKTGLLTASFSLILSGLLSFLLPKGTNLQKNNHTRC